MKTFIEENKSFLKFYHTALRLSGCVLLTLGFCSYGITGVLVNVFELKTFRIIAMIMPMGSLEFILFGLLGFGIAQLIRYLFDRDCKTGFILRHGTKFLYTYVILMLFVMVLRCLMTFDYMQSKDIENGQNLFIVISITAVVLFAAKALILIGLAQFLKRILPIIEEHKSLI